MKLKLLLITLSVFMLHETGKSQWAVIPSGTVENLVDIEFSSDSVGYIISSTGLILKSVDSGNSWASVATLTGNFTCINALSGDTVIAGGSDMYRSDDGGNTWSLIKSFGFIMSDLLFYTSDHGLGIRYNTTLCQSSTGNMTQIDCELYETTDFGLNWQMEAGLLNIKKFLSSENIAYVLSANVIFGGSHCMPGGNTFYCRSYYDNLTTIDTLPNIVTHPYSLSLINDSTIIMIDNQCNYTRKVVSGITYLLGTATNISTSNYISDMNLVAIDSAFGYLRRENEIFITNGNYSSWTLDYNSTIDLNFMKQCKSGIYAIGNSGLILRILLPVGITESNADDLPFLIYPNPASNYFVIELPGYEAGVNLSITDFAGKEVKTYNINEKRTVFSTNIFAKGMYLIEMRSANRVFKPVKFLIQ